MNNFATSVTEGKQRHNNFKQNSYSQSKNKDTRHAGNKETKLKKILPERIMVEETKTPMSESASHVGYAKKSHMEVC